MIKLWTDWIKFSSYHFKKLSGGTFFFLIFNFFLIFDQFSDNRTSHTFIRGRYDSYTTYKVQYSALSNIMLKSIEFLRVNPLHLYVFNLTQRYSRNWFLSSFEQISVTPPPPHIYPRMLCAMWKRSVHASGKNVNNI